ncbi:MAG: glycosyltransferase [Capsulimonadales bacterium]|nr:glycosyltransferase [Capsulimonadales bacterium]
MRNVAFVVAEPWHSTDWSTDLGLLVREFRRRGTDASLTCLRRVGPEPDYPVFEATSAEMTDPAYWRRRTVTVAIVFNWLIRAGDVLIALRAAGAFVLQYGDSDGLEGMRVHPGAQVVRMWHLQPSFLRKVGGVATLARKYLYGHRREDALLVRNAESAHLTTLTSEPARAAFLRFLRFARRTDLANRVRVLPSPVAAPFRTRPIEPRPRPVVVAVGRWDDPQKDAPLLAAALHRYLSDASPETEVRLIGGGGETPFARLVRDFAGVRYFGRIPHADLTDRLADARILFFASRWEGTPVVSLEMVALGGTVVGPGGLPGLAQFAAEGHGTAAVRRSPVALAQALREEMTAWESGERRPETIAAYWRVRVSPESIVDRWIEWVGNEKR